MSTVNIIVEEQEGTVERVLMNPETGMLAVGVRLRFMDKYYNNELQNLNGYSLFLEPKECDAWAVDCGDTFWIVVSQKHMSKFECLGEL